MRRTTGTPKQNEDSDGEKSRKILIKTCKRNMIIWCDDANGQVGRDEEEK